MPLDETVLQEVEAARECLENLEDEVFEARARFHQSIRRLHGAGGSMREIAAALGMSHQRVHQIVGEDAIVEVEATARDVRPLPVPVVAGQVATVDRCSFCGAARSDGVRLLGAGPGAAAEAFICATCVPAARGRLHVEAARECSFCGRLSTSAAAAAGAAVICEGCVAAGERLLGGREPRKTMGRLNSRLRCSFCNGGHRDTSRVIGGPSVYICGDCVPAATAVAASGAAMRGPRSVTLQPAEREPHPCGFCGKVPVQVRSMVKGGRGRICDECLELCQTALAEDDDEAGVEGVATTSSGG